MTYEQTHDFIAAREDEELRALIGAAAREMARRHLDTADEIGAEAYYSALAQERYSAKMN
jgi:hypothetical protein